ncbi:MAG: hypothetical protein ACHQUA_00290 [Microgenomates group bacterium]
MKKKEAKVSLGLPELLKKQSRFSGASSSFGSKGPATKFTPPPVRFTQHKGGN